MNELKYLAVGYIFFVLLIVGEVAISLWRRDHRYRLHEAIGNIGHGVVYQTFDYYTKALVMVPFAAVASQLALFQLPTDALWAWLLAVLAYDFMSYWAHRHSHEINAMWAVHAVHHAAEDFNLAAALRQPLFSHLFIWVYRLPLALFMPVDMFVGLVVFDYLYQFVMHTQYVPKLGPIGWLMNTPSHHRVHHGRNAKYLDRNYGGIFIVWDRLFGSFQVEEEAPEYGITDPIGSVDPIWGNLVFWKRLMDASRRAPDLRSRLAVWFQGPGDLAPAEKSVSTGVKIVESVLPVPSKKAVYVLSHAVIAFPALPVLIYFGSLWGLAAQMALAGFLLASTTALVALLEGRRWAPGFESARLLVFALGLFWLVPATLEAVTEPWRSDESEAEPPVASA